MHLSSNIRVLRKQKGLTQAQLGVIFNLTDSQITNYEKGKLYPPVELLLRMCSYFEVDMNSFFHVDMSNTDKKTDSYFKKEPDKKSELTEMMELSLTDRVKIIEDKLKKLERKIGE
jgi:transcriptional regulator with XRE-family HTH domain